MNNTNNITEQLKDTIIDAIKTVYDPEFPVVDIYTLGLIYDISYNNEKKEIFIMMTLTSPACPVGDMIVEMTKNAINEKIPDYNVLCEITFEPMWSPEMIKDDDLKRMFDIG